MENKKKASKKKIVRKKTAKRKSKKTTARKTTSRHKRRTSSASKEEPQKEEKVTGGEYSSNTGQQQSSSSTDGLLGGLANKATKIVEQAASILEEEIAAGIIAARNVEERYVNVNTLRAADAEHVMQRFRKDAHEVVDILLDLVNVSLNSLGGLTRRVVSVQGGPVSNEEKAGKPAAATIPTLQIPGALKANETGEISMSVENDSNTATDEFTFRCSGLLSTHDEGISPDNIKFNPDKIVVGPNTFEKVVISVTVPENTKPGVYSGLLQATRLSHVRAILSVVVEE